MALGKGVYKFFAISWVIILVSGNSYAQSKTGIEIIWKDNKAASISIPVSLFEEDLSEIILKSFLQIRLSGEQANILGNRGIWKDEVIFKPMWSFTANMSYDVVWREKVIESFEVIQVNESNPPHVLATYPSSDTLPENLLKFYIEFSLPMSAGKVYEYIHLYKNGLEVENVFLKLESELWNTDQTILTVWLDPGRIKRNLQPNLAMGEPLLMGSDYELIIEGGWKDVNGNALGNSISRYFTASESDRSKPDLRDWDIKLPNSKSMEALVIDFGEPLDYILSKNAIRVIDINGQNVPGSIEIEENETKWKFLPDIAWISAEYTLLIETRLEDLAGNNLNRLFDSDLGNAIDIEELEMVKLDFRIK